jgi:hypothetical protein
VKKVLGMYATVAVSLLFLGAANQAWADHGSQNSQNNTETRLRTRLSGAAVQGKTPEGNADFRSNSRGRTRLNVEVENVNLPAGTVLQVSVQHAGMTVAVGTITMTAGGFGELELNSQDGDTVPQVQSGDMIMVANGGMTILAGVF